MKVLKAIFVLCWIAIKANAQFFGAPSAQCYNPNQRIGTCVSIYDCQAILSVLERSPLQPSDSEFVAASKCFGGYGRDPFVCCTRDTDFTRNQDDTNNWDSPPRRRQNNDFVYNDGAMSNGWGGQSSKRNSNLLPKECGGVSFGNKILGGVDADLFEFPWMVLLEYKKRTGGISTSCAGSLINNRYVLTAAHCVKGRIEIEVGQLTFIRLGEHDQSSQIDCDQSSCAQEAVRVGIDAITPHESYRDESANKAHDIALIRMDRKIRFTDSMRPICLPFVVQQEQNRNEADISYTAAGWGSTLTGAKSNIKQKLVMQSVDQQQCARTFRQRKVDILDSQLCAGGEYGQDSCRGDSGGPLMDFRSGVWVLEGIISFGIKCGLQGMPAVHTRVSSYDDWIRNNIRA